MAMDQIGILLGKRKNESLIQSRRSTYIPGRYSKLLVPLAAIVTLILLSLGASSYLYTVLETILVTTLLAVGLDLILGYTGMFSFGHAAFMGIGSYVAANLLLRTSMPLLVVILIAMVVSGVFGIPVGMMAVRVSGDYFALITLGFGEIGYLVFNNWTSVTGGQTGLPGIPIASVFGWHLVSIKQVYLFSLCLTVLVLLLCSVLVGGFFGRAMVAVREDPIVASSQGIHIGRLQVGVFALGCAIAGIAGTLQALQLNFVGATNFSLTQSVLAIEVIVVGGTGTVWGSLYGAALFTMLAEQLRALQIYSQAIFGIIVLIVLIAFPAGIAGIFGRIENLLTTSYRKLRHNQVPDSQSIRKAHSGALGRIPDQELLLAQRATTGISPAVPTQTVGVSRSIELSPLLAATRVSKAFGGVLALDNMSINVYPREIVALIGPNGSGKTTLLNVLSGIIKPSNGLLEIDGRPCEFLPSAEVIRQYNITRTFQHIRLCNSFSVLDNVLIGCHRSFTIFSHAQHFGSQHGPAANRGASSARSKAMDALQLVGIEALAHVPAGDLSYGDQRRTEIARAIVLNPSLVLLDEPAAGMNVDESNALEDVLLAIREREISLLIVEHNMSLVADIADRVVVMDAGSLLMEGSPDEVASDDRVRTAYLGA